MSGGLRIEKGESRRSKVESRKATSAVTTRGSRHGPFILHPSSFIFRSSGRRRGLILVVVLVMVALLALLAGSYAFMASANLHTVMADHHRFQARMAAESGVQRAIMMLRRNPDDPDVVADLDRWFDNPEAFRGALVYGSDADRSEGKETFRERTEADADEDATYDPTAEPAWRFNLVAADYDHPETVRYGITDECSKLDLNRAEDSQLHRLFEMIIPDDPDHEVDIDVLVDSLLDWRDTDRQPRPSGAENAYYESLDPPYRCKSGDFSTVAELLLVRDCTGWILFGEDYNRNGLLDANEDDGEESFPEDNADGELYRGIAPFVTVWSRELNTSNDQRPRINLNIQDLEKLEEKLGEEDLDGNIISYIMDVRASGITFRSVMELLPAPDPPEIEDEDPDQEVPPESGQPDEDEATSQPAEENPGGEGEGLADLDGTETSPAPENAAASNLPVYENLTADDPPGHLEDLPLILDRLTVDVAPAFVGRINISTAPREVLAAIEDLTDEELDAIVAARAELTGEQKATPAWLVTEGVLDLYRFRQILDKITTRSSVFQIESVGYADHLGVIERLNVVIDMIGPTAQVLYYRNLSSLGPAYTPHGEERRGIKERSN